MDDGRPPGHRHVTVDIQGAAELPQLRERVAVDVVVLQRNARQSDDLVAGPVVAGGVVPLQKAPVQQCAQMAGNRTDS